MYLANEAVAYPPEAVLGPTLFSVPVEELFFFVVQTYIVSIVYSRRLCGSLTRSPDDLSTHTAQ